MWKTDTRGEGTIDRTEEDINCRCHGMCYTHEFFLFISQQETTASQSDITIIEKKTTPKSRQIV